MTKRMLNLLLGAAMMLAFTVPAMAQLDAQARLSLHSPAFSSNASIPKRFSCQGQGVSPPLSWSGVPDKTKSLALIVDDPDAPSGTYVHWVAYNLAPDTAQLKQGASKHLPAGAAMANNSAHEQNYHGMCPPSGQHRYRFKLYALDTKLDSGPKNKAAVRAAMKGHVLAHTQLVATYAKQ